MRREFEAFVSTDELVAMVNGVSRGLGLALVRKYASSVSDKQRCRGG